MTISNRLCAETPFARKFSLGYFVNGGGFGCSYFAVNPSHKDAVVEQLKHHLKAGFTNPDTIVSYNSCGWNSVEKCEIFRFDVVSVCDSFRLSCQVFSV